MEPYVDICIVTLPNAECDFEEDDVDASGVMTRDDMLVFRRGDDGGLEWEGGRHDGHEDHDGRGDRGRLQHPGGLTEQQLLRKQLQVRLKSSRSSTCYFWGVLLGAYNKNIVTKRMRGKTYLRRDDWAV